MIGAISPIHTFDLFKAIVAFGSGFTTIVITVDVAGLPVKHELALEVITTLTASPLTSVAVE
jgi:hypothetical protein